MCTPPTEQSPSALTKIQSHSRAARGKLKKAKRQSMAAVKLIGGARSTLNLSLYS